MTTKERIIADLLENCQTYLFDNKVNEVSANLKLIKGLIENDKTHVPEHLHYLLDRVKRETKIIEPR